MWRLNQVGADKSNSPCINIALGRSQNNCHSDVFPIEFLTTNIKVNHNNFRNMCILSNSFDLSSCNAIKSNCISSTYIKCRVKLNYYYIAICQFVSFSESCVLIHPITKVKRSRRSVNVKVSNLWKSQAQRNSCLPYVVLKLTAKVLHLYEIILDRMFKRRKIHLINPLISVFHRFNY